MRASMGAPLTSWPWGNLGSYKYLLYGPLLPKAIASKAWQSTSTDQWCAHLILLFALRALTYQLWTSFSNMLFVNRRRRIIRDGVDYDQIDKEWDWDNFLILQFWMAAMALYAFPSLRHLPLWDARGVAMALLCHVAATEPLFYLLHRAFHRSGFLFSNYHSLHHSAKVPQPFTAGFATPLEHLTMSALMAAPLAAACAAGLGSVRLLFGYMLVFDSLRAMGHCNVEVFPGRLFQAIPAVRYLIGTPTYHTIHHTDKDTNFCLFMPLFDLLGGTLNDKSWELQKKTSSGTDDEIPGFVFLAHVVDLSQSLHVHFVFRSFASTPYATTLALVPLWPGAFVFMLAMWAWSKTFLVSSYTLRGRLQQLWVVPRHGFHYFLPFAKDGINRQIELAILRADKMGVKVLSLAALNKNEALNGGGTLFVDKYPDLRVRVVHGNTLTAAVILREIPDGTAEVFLTGATSKLGRAIALYLSRKRIRVMVKPTESYVDAVDREVPEDPERGGPGGPAVPGPGHEVPICAELQDVDRGKVADAAGAEVGAGRHALPPVRGAAGRGVPPGLHLRQAGGHAASRRRPRPGDVRVLAGARRGARMSRGRPGALPRGVRAPRGGCHRRRPHRRCLGGRAAPRPAPRLTDDLDLITGPVTHTNM